jgi:hypothetical protein
MAEYVKKYVLNVERIANWEADQTAGFSHLGLSDRRRKLFESLREKDIIVTYVSGNGFVDVREILKSGVSKLGIKGNYPDGAWPWLIHTRLIANVGLEKAISPRLLSNTKLCAGEWRYRFQQSGKLLEPKDGKIIADAIIKVASARKK